jgi:glucosamine-6-phosphate deaminase
MRLRIFPDTDALAEAAAADASTSIRAAIEARGRARIVAATGVSQIAFLRTLVALPGIAWSQVELFQLDEYVGIPATHRASFQRYVLDRLVRPTGVSRLHLLDGAGDPARVIREAGAAVGAAPIDVVFAGIGENAHLAFNDPPADFTTTEPYFEVVLAEAARRQQVNEGWFANLDDVPARAITMSVRQILAAGEIFCMTPEGRKARAVRACFAGPVTPLAPASILQRHARATIYLDPASASLLPRGAVRRFSR